MSKTKIKFPNTVLHYRERLGFTQDQLAHIAGCKHSRRIRRIESGSVMPASVTVMRIAAALRVPVEILYRKTYEELREQVRATEERMPKGTQGMLPLAV
jgi:transcriptional regulator with XRE-family HTH domain